MGSLKIIFLSTVFILSFFIEIKAANNEPDAPSAFIRSMILPGWGHYYVDKENWNRGKLHLGAEAVFIASYFGLLNRVSNLENRYITLASLKAGVNIEDRNRSFQIAIGEYPDLNEYNDFQLRSRNWNRLLEESPENSWNWKTEEDRSRYNQLRSERDRVKNQLPGIIGLLAVNRVVSAISSYNRARNHNKFTEISILPVIDDLGTTGAVLNVSYRF